MDFHEIFDTKRIDGKNTEIRDKFLSRVFGIFSEEIVRVWCRSTISPFIDLGRSTIKEIDDATHGSILDFTLQDKNTKKKYISEMKCEIQYENYKYLELMSITDLNHHNKTAFQRFLGIAQNPNNYQIMVKGNKINVEGAILIWGKTNPKSNKSICETTGLTDILSLEDIINDLIKIKSKEYLGLLNQKKVWLDYLMKGLKK